MKSKCFEISSHLKLFQICAPTYLKEKDFSTSKEHCRKPVEMNCFGCNSLKNAKFLSLATQIKFGSYLGFFSHFDLRKGN